MSFTIRIEEKTRVEKRENRWKQVTTDPLRENAEGRRSMFDYVDGVETVDHERVVLLQTVESLDLPRVIAAVNRLQLAEPPADPPKGALDI